VVLVGETDWLPEVVVSDVQETGEVAWQELALVLDQLSMVELPAVIASCNDDNVTDGGIFTVTIELLVIPPLPIQVIM
jgi:hypothetical protein